MIAGRYTLVREIGRGGMGAVWLARDETLARDVALKRVATTVPGEEHHPSRAAGSVSDREDRAAREARIAAQLRHPGIVAVHDLVSEGDERWLVLEYVPGRSLADLVRDEGKLSAERAASLLAQAAEALAAAHRAGVVHRDVKPSNMLVDDSDRLKLSDFGIARSSTDPSLTQTGMVTGSPSYLAPEVAEGRSASPASDVWSLGATGFHLLTGKPPYQAGDNVMGALYRIVHEPAPRPPDAGGLEPFFERTMQHDEATRWTATDAHQFLRDFTTTASPALFAGGTGGPDDDPRRGFADYLPALVGAAVIVLAVLIGAILVTGDQSPEPTAGEPAASADPTDSSSDSTEPPAESPSPPEVTSTEGPVAGDMKRFVRAYLKTAANDPGQGFQLLTEEFQEQSDQYQNFWSRVSDPRVRRISAEPDTLEVSYTYTYRFRGSGQRTETVNLRLAFEEGAYLIAGES